MSGFFVLLLIVGLAMLVGPFFVLVPMLTRLLLMLVGTVTTAMSMIFLMISRWYHKASSDEAIVRTGSDGVKVIIDGGILVLPTLHKSMRVPLKVRKIAFDLAGADGLVTKDKLKSDMHSEFYLRVGATPEQVLNASRLFGEQADDVFDEMVRVKLVSAMRSVAAKYGLAELNSDGEAFSGSVKELVAKNIEQDGLILEAAAISKMPIIGI